MKDWALSNHWEKVDFTQLLANYNTKQGAPDIRGMHYAMRKMLHFMRALGARCILPHLTQGELFLLGGHGSSFN